MRGRQSSLPYSCSAFADATADMYTLVACAVLRPGFSLASQERIMVFSRVGAEC